MQSTLTQLDIKDYLRIFWRRKWLFILTFLPIAGTAFFVSTTLSPVYRSTTTILVERQKVPSSYVQSTVGTDIRARLRTIETQIMSRTRLEKIAEDYGLQYYSITTPGLKNQLLSKFGVEIKKKSLSKEMIVGRMRKDIKIIVQGSDAFRVSFVAPEPEVAMRVTNALASMFIEENLKLREQYAEGTSEFLASELKKAEQELEEREIAVRAFKQKYMGSLPKQLDANLRTLDRLQLERQTINNAKKSVKDRKMLMETQLRDLGNPGAESNPLVSQMSPIEKKLVDLRNTLSSLRSVFKDNYPDVIIVKNRIKEVEKRLAEDRNQPDEERKDEKLSVFIQNPGERRLRAELKLIKSEIKGLNIREATVKRQIKEFERRVEESYANEQKLITLQRDYGIMQGNYQSLMEKKISSRLAVNLEKRQKGEQFRILDPANLPMKPFGERAKKMRQLGLMAGVGVGIGLIFLIEFLNPAFRKPEDFLGIVDIPVIAFIPGFSMKSVKK